MNLSASIVKNGLLLFAFAVIMAGVLAVTYSETKPTIAAAERRAAEKALLEIIPAERFDNDLLLDTTPVPNAAWDQLGLAEGGYIHLAREDGEIVALIIPAIAADGYSGEIKLIVGVNIDGTVAGVRVLAHRETPGLGDKIDLKKSEWIKSFDGRSLEQPSPENWKVKKDGGAFDQFTGATITPRAVVNQVFEVLNFMQAYRAQLLPEKNTSPVKRIESSGNRENSGNREISGDREQ